MTEPFAERLIAKLAPWNTGPAINGSTDFERWLRALAAPAELVESLTTEVGEQGEPGWVPPYGVVMNPVTCPGKLLPWLAQFVGVPLPIGTPEAEARAIIKAESGLARGTEASMKAAIERAISRFWMADTEFLKGQLVRHETIPGELLCYEATATFTSGATFSTTHLTLINIATQYELLSREKANGESSPYYFTVLVHPQQLLPEGNTGQLDTNVKGTKPAGLVPEYVLTEEPLQTDPLIDEFTLPIEEIKGEEIVTLTLADVT
jgi:hypothetical protein